MTACVVVNNLGEFFTSEVNTNSNLLLYLARIHKACKAVNVHEHEVAYAKIIYYWMIIWCVILP